MLSLFVDCLFRALFFSFLSASWVFPEKAGLFAMGLLYVLIIAIYIERKDLQDNSYEATFKGALASLVASAWQDKELLLKECEGGVISIGISNLIPHSVEKTTVPKLFTSYGSMLCQGQVPQKRLKSSL